VDATPIFLGVATRMRNSPQNGKTLRYPNELERCIRSIFILKQSRLAHICKKEKIAHTQIKEDGT
jgi:hypothetical protein